MRTTHDAAGPRVCGGWWRKVGALGVALVLPGGLVLLLYLMARSRTRADSTLRDPYVEWLRMRDRVRSEWRPAASVEGATSTWQAPNGRTLPPSARRPSAPRWPLRGTSRSSETTSLGQLALPIAEKEKELTRRGCYAPRIPVTTARSAPSCFSRLPLGPPSAFDELEETVLLAVDPDEPPVIEHRRGRRWPEPMKSGRPRRRDRSFEIVHLVAQMEELRSVAHAPRDRGIRAQGLEELNRDPVQRDER